MSALHLPAAGADPDLLRRGVRAAWTHLPWVVLGSAVWSAGLVLALRGAGGSAAGTAVLAAVLTIPGACLLVLLADHLVLEAAVGRHELRRVAARHVLRMLTIAAVPVVALSILTALILAYPRVPVLLGSVGLAVSGAVVLATTVLAPVALALALRRPDAPWPRLWLVAALASSRRPVPVLGAWAAVVALALLAWHVQILLLVAPGLAAATLVAGAWTALPSLGIHPTSAPPSGHRPPVPGSAGPGEPLRAPDHLGIRAEPGRN